MKKSKLVALFISAAFAIVLAGCSSPTVTPALTYTVTYVDGVDDAEIAVPTDSASYHAGDTVTVKFDGIGNRSGFTFAGWSDGTNTYTSNGTTSFTMGSANVTLTATWTVITSYTVTYVDGVDDAEITVPTDSASYHAGDTVTVKFDGIGNRSGFTFAGWSDGTNTYTSNGTTSFTMGSANVTLTATWTDIHSYTVTYVDGVDDAEIAVPTDSASYHAGDTVTVKFDGIGNRSGFAFTGWSDGTNTYTSNGTTSFTMGSANVTLTAQWKAYIGTKDPNVPKEVGDIVFNDGSATPYIHNMSITNEQKSSAIAIIFYKGNGLNNDVNGTSDTTTVRTLGVGLKHFYASQKELQWCRWISDEDCAVAYNENITTIQCHANETDRSFTGDKNGSDNLEQIADYLTANNKVNDTGVGDSNTSSVQAALNYPAFYFAKNYKDVEGSRVSGTAYENGWYLPSMAELFWLYYNGLGTNKLFSLNTALAYYCLDGTQFSGMYLSSSQSDIADADQWIANACLAGLFYGNSHCSFAYKNATEFHSCAIREFN